MKEKLQNEKELIHSKLQATNKRFNKISANMGELTKNLDFTQNKLDEELINVKKEIKKLDQNIGNMKNDLLDSDKDSSKLKELKDRSHYNILRTDGVLETILDLWRKKFRA